MAGRRAVALSLRLALVYALLVAATLLVVLGIAVRLVRSELTGEVDRRLVATVTSFQETAARRATGEAALVREARQWLARQAFPENQVAAVRTSGRQVLTSVGGLDLHAVPGSAALLESSTSGWRTLDTPAGPVRALAVPVLSGDRQIGTLVVAAEVATTGRTIRALLIRIAWASVAGLLFATVLGVLTLRRALRPLSGMARDIQAIEAAGDLSRRVDPGGPRDEVGRLAETFDRMLERLQEAFASQQRFLSDASHELRTPLTVLQGRLELLQQEVDTAEAERSLALAGDEVERIRRIVDDLLLLARLDEGMPVAGQPVEVELIAQEAVLRGLSLARREMSVKIEPGVFALADPERLLQVLTNLVANAVEHAGEDATIHVTGRRDGPWAVVEVSDTGPGIPPVDLPHLFDRFYRGTQATHQSGRGAGLGLAIVSSLVRAMRGTISVASNPGEGTTFTIRLPAAGPTAPRPAPGPSADERTTDPLPVSPERESRRASRGGWRRSR